MDVVKKVINDGRKQLHKEYETTRRKSIVWYYHSKIFEQVQQNIERINDVARQQTRPFTVELTGISGEVCFKYLKGR